LSSKFGAIEPEKFDINWPIFEKEIESKNAQLVSVKDVISEKGILIASCRPSQEATTAPQEF
jgi:hypothetical protein